MGLPSIKNNENLNNSINKGTRPVVTDRIKLDKTKTLLNKAM